MTLRSPPAPIEIEVVHDLAQLPAEDWNAAVDPNDPFTEHAFLALLEESESVGRLSGWLPVHLLARQEGRVVGASPLYLKNNSNGEYIFDWGWAESAHRAGIPYYPKLVSAVPFTPATGRRLLTQDPRVAAALLDGMRGVAEATKARSVHVLFMTAAEQKAITDSETWISRTTHQFHWDNDGYTDFDDWLSRFRSRRRKEVRRERAVVGRAGCTVRMLRGEALTAEYWERLWRFYSDTTMRKHAHAYLSPEFFSLAPSRLAHSAVAFVAEVDGRVVAAALCFQRGEHLYGRYWGCEEEYRSLHFELCYHAPIEAAISNGWTHFEAGAQGMHKLQRGLVPARTYSVHHLKHRGLHQAVDQAMQDEGRQVEQEMTWLNKQTPFHRDDAGPR